MNNMKYAEELKIPDLINSGPMVIIAPHQDDETLGCGGTIALAVKLGIQIYVVFVTDGSQSHPQSKNYPFDVLVPLREIEAKAALSILGVKEDHVYFLRMGDGALPLYKDPEFISSSIKILNILIALRPGVIFLPWRRDPHRDHKATWQLCMEAIKEFDGSLRIFEYFIWLWERAVPDDHPKPTEGILRHVNISAVNQLKQKAISAHISQTTGLIDDDENGFTLSVEMLHHFDNPNEYFNETTSNMMINNSNSLSENYFDEVYRAKEDPWNLATSDYERDKYNATLAALPRDNYNSVLEVGCSIGVLTQVLLQKCKNILGVDVADAPVLQARKRLIDYPQATIEKMAVPETFPDENFDLIVMSEVGYFFSFTDLNILAEKIEAHLNVHGQLLMVHWIHFVPDFPLSGDQVHEFLLNRSGVGQPFKHLYHQRTDDYRLDLFEIQ